MTRPPIDPAALIAATEAAGSGLDLPDQIRRHRERALATLRELAPGRADWVAEAPAAAAEAPAVVLLGETKRGKSALVNALLARQGLSPVDAEAATATRLVFRHAERWAARACYPGREPVSFAVEELPRWVAVAGRLPDGALPPTSIEVDAPVPLLRRVRLVDTPGLGGLGGQPGEPALAAAALATVLLVVVDASAPFGRGELTFLRRAAERVDTVLFALTKIDRFRGWREVLAADRALLAEHAPRFAGASIHPVSARLFEQAASAPTPELAAVLRQRSGVAELQLAVQRELLGRAAQLAEANTLRALSTAFAGVTVTLAAERRAVATGEAEAAALRARRAELIEARRESTRGWRLRLRGEIGKARLETVHDVGREIRELAAWFRAEIDGAGRDALDLLPARVDAGLRAVSERVGAGLGWRLNRIADPVLTELFTAAELVMLRAGLTPAAAAPIAVRPPVKRPPTAEDKLLVFMGVSSGLGLGRAAALPLAGLGVTAAVTPVLLPVTIVLGLGAGWWMARTRRHAQDKAQLKQWLGDAIADARGTLDQLVAEQLIDAEQRLTLALSDAVTRRLATIDDGLREVERALTLAAADRAARLRDLDRALAEARSTHRRTDGFLARLHGDRG